MKGKNKDISVILSTTLGDYLMKNLLTTVVVGIFLFLMAGLVQAAEKTKETKTELSALDIMEKQEVQFRVNDEARLMSMILKPKKGVERDRKLFMVIKKTQEGELNTLFRITEPQDVRGVGLLSYELEKRYDQWLFTPQDNKIKRLSRSAMTDTALGSDFTFEDLQFENLKIHNYKLLGSKEIKGQDCWVIEITPKDKKEARNTAYSKRIYYIRKDIYFYTQVEFYDKKDRFVKTLDLDNIVEVGPGIHRNLKFTMVNFKTGHETTVTIDKIAINQGLPEDYFTHRFLTRQTETRPAIK
jgi:outer membrane lipoprotein-sorting protein